MLKQIVHLVIVLTKNALQRLEKIILFVIIKLWFFLVSNQITNFFFTKIKNFQFNSPPLLIKNKINLLDQLFI